MAAVIQSQKVPSAQCDQFRELCPLLRSFIFDLCKQVKPGETELSVLIMVRLRNEAPLH